MIRTQLSQFCLKKHHRFSSKWLSLENILQKRTFLSSVDHVQCFRPNGPASRYVHTLPGVSAREMAALEERVWKAVGSQVVDPVLKKDMKTLDWMHQRLALSKDGTLQILLRLPTLLHPSLEELKNRIQSVAEDEIKSWASEKKLTIEAKANVEALPSKPFPWMASSPEDHKEIVSRLGPGFANVTHCLAVYSCKVG